MEVKKAANGRRWTPTMMGTRTERLIAAVKENSKIQMVLVSAIEKMVRLVEKPVRQEESRARS